MTSVMIMIFIFFVLLKNDDDEACNAIGCWPILGSVKMPMRDDARWT